MDGILLLLYIITVANIAMLIILSFILTGIASKIGDIKEVLDRLKYRF